MTPVGTLWTDLDAGLGTRTWVFGGDVPRHPPSGPFATFFRIVASGQPGNAIRKAPPSNMGAMLNFIGACARGTGGLERCHARGGWRPHFS